MKFNTTPVPNVVFDKYLKELKLAELKILLIIIRQTIGWVDKFSKSRRKEKDWISGSQLALKTGSSNRAINEAIQILVQKKLIDVLSASGDFLDTPEKRRGQQRLYFRLANAFFADVEIVGNNGLHQQVSGSANANFAEDLRKKLTDLTQKMHITKETIQN